MRAGMLALTALSGSGVAKLFSPPIVVRSGENERETKVTDIIDLFNRPEVRECEVPSANGHASARALAAIAAMMAEQGSFAGHRLLSTEGFAAGVGDPVELKLFGLNFKFTNAGWCLWEGRRDQYV